MWPDARPFPSRPRGPLLTLSGVSSCSSVGGVPGPQCGRGLYLGGPVEHLDLGWLGRGVSRWQPGHGAASDSDRDGVLAQRTAGSLSSRWPRSGFAPDPGSVRDTPLFSGYSFLATCLTPYPRARGSGSGSLALPPWAASLAPVLSDCSPKTCLMFSQWAPATLGPSGPFITMNPGFLDVLPVTTSR